MGERLPTVDVRAFDPSDPSELDPVIAHLRAGGLVAYPTETVYGFGGGAAADPVARLQRLKQRGPEQPFLLLVGGAHTVPELVWNDAARELAEVFWPGALTLVLADPSAAYPAGVRSPAGGVAVRQSAHPVAAALVTGLGGPLTSTSANAPGRAAARSGREAAAAARELGAAPDDIWIVDAGVLPPSPPSTLVDCTEEVPRILREGAIPLSRLRCVRPETHD